MQRWTNAVVFLACVLVGTVQIADRCALAQSATSSEGSTQASYDPIAVDKNLKIETLEFEFSYRPEIKFLRGSNAQAEDRTVPVKATLTNENRAPVVLFSHGLGGSRDGFRHGGEHWARRGYVAIFIQHPGSDASVWRDKPLGQRMTAMRDAASAQNLLLRIADVKATIDYLEKIEQGDAAIAPAALRLKSRMDLNRIGMSGHSFGAIITQMVSGQTPAIPTQSPNDPRIRAAVVLSPSPPKLGQPERYFGKVSIPWLLMTGTKDDSPIGDQSAESRLQVFSALPPGSKYQVVFDGGSHAFLGERPGSLAPTVDQPSHARSTIALSTAFWDAYLMQNDEARRWLDGSGPRTILAAKDQWDRK